MSTPREKQINQRIKRLMPSPPSPRKIYSSSDPAMAALKELWRKMKKKDRTKWRNILLSRRTRAKIREMILSQLKISIKTDHHLDNFRTWMHEQDKREAQEKEIANELKELEDTYGPDLPRRKIRDFVLRNIYNRAEKEGDSKLSLDTVKADVQESTYDLHERKYENSRLENFEKAFLGVMSIVDPFPEEAKLFEVAFEAAAGLHSQEAKERLAKLIESRRKPSRNTQPRRSSFIEFLTTDARVRGGEGMHISWTFEGREALRHIVELFDQILKEKLTDSEIALAGGAQFGKTTLELNFAAYVTSQLFHDFGLYLPDDDLVQGIVDSKFRPDVVDQIPWFAKMVQVGKELNKSGRSVNRKGAFLVTDGVLNAVGMIRGLGKVPTTFSMDVAAMDEVDDINPDMMKFVRGRLSASDLRLILEIGTQRIHGRGMNKSWKDRSQGVIILKCPQCGHAHNPEEEFPGIVRLRNVHPVRDEVSSLKSENSQGISTTEHLNQSDTRAGGQFSFSPGEKAGMRAGINTTPFSVSSPPSPLCHPSLTWSGDFKLPGSEATVAVHKPGNEYFLGCVKCGAELNRRAPVWEHRQPDQVQQRKWSFRISQLGIAAIDLSQIVARFQSAVADPEEMIVFRCDVLALPQSTSQALTPAILDRARSVEVFDLAPRVTEGRTAYGGLDMGDRCWLLAREISNLKFQISNSADRLLAVEKISSGDVVERVQVLFQQLGLSALFIDERPLVNDARALALALNGLESLEVWPKITDPKTNYITLPGGLTWDGPNSRWLNLKCALVRFTKTSLGQGITQSIITFQQNNQTKFVPCIQCNRFETIDRVVRELLTPDEGVVDVVAGKVRFAPGLLLPRQTPGNLSILSTLDSQLITGSEREKTSDGELDDYTHDAENHLLLASAYSKLAEMICTTNKPAPFAVESVKVKRG